MKNLSLIILLLIGIVACNNTPLPAEQDLPPNEFLGAIEKSAKNAVLIDVRTPKEVAEGKIFTTAMEIDFYSDEFEEQLKGLDKSLDYFVYCKSGGRSGKTCQKMKELGFEKVYNLKGGMTAFNSMNLKQK